MTFRVYDHTFAAVDHAVAVAGRIPHRRCGRQVLNFAALEDRVGIVLRV
jgi:hypothetical protein